MDDGFVVVSVRRRTSWSTPEKELVRVLHSVNWLGREVSSLKTISECFFPCAAALDSLNGFCMVRIQKHRSSFISKNALMKKERPFLFWVERA